MSRPTVIASYTNGSFAGVSISVPNVLVGDWLVVCQSTMYSPSYAMAAPTGSGSGAYTEIGTRAGTSNSSANADMRAWYKTCTSAGTHTVTVADDGTESENMLVVLHMRGCAAIDGTPTQAEAAQTVNSASQSYRASPPPPPRTPFCWASGRACNSTARSDTQSPRQ